jgi:hypothetical protein
MERDRITPIIPPPRDVSISPPTSTPRSGNDVRPAPSNDVGTLFDRRPRIHDPRQSTIRIRRIPSLLPLRTEANASSSSRIGTPVQDAPAGAGSGAATPSPSSPRRRGRPRSSTDPLGDLTLAELQLIIDAQDHRDSASGPSMPPLTEETSRSRAAFLTNDDAVPASPAVRERGSTRFSSPKTEEEGEEGAAPEKVPAGVDEYHSDLVDLLDVVG